MKVQSTLTLQQEVYLYNHYVPNKYTLKRKVTKFKEIMRFTADDITTTITANTQSTKITSIFNNSYLHSNEDCVFFDRKSISKNIAYFREFDNETSRLFKDKQLNCFKNTSERLLSAYRNPQTVLGKLLSSEYFDRKISWISETSYNIGDIIGEYKVCVIVIRRRREGDVARYYSLEGNLLCEESLISIL